MNFHFLEELPTNVPSVSFEQPNACQLECQRSIDVLMRAGNAKFKRPLTAGGKRPTIIGEWGDNEKGALKSGEK